MKIRLNENQEIVDAYGFKTVEDVLNYYGCKLIKETKSKDSKYSKDIYVNFKYDTFEGDESKKRFFFLQIY